MRYSEEAVAAAAALPAYAGEDRLHAAVVHSDEKRCQCCHAPCPQLLHDAGLQLWILTQTDSQLCCAAAAREAWEGAAREHTKARYSRRGPQRV